MPKEWANKPMDLHPMGVLHDPRTYQCQACGDRYNDHQVDEIGGLCPRDGSILRPLGHFERSHRELWSSWWRRSA